MIDLLDIRHVRLGTRDRGAADRFARGVVGLQAVREEQGARYYRSDSRDHTLVYFEGDPTRHTVGFELRDAAALDAAAAQLSDAGFKVRLGNADESEQRRVGGFVNFSFCMWGSVPDIAEFKRDGAGTQSADAPR